MWLVLVSLMSMAQNGQTECQRVAETPNFVSGARVVVVPDCKSPAVTSVAGFDKSVCKQARMHLLFPEPYASDQMMIEFVETRRDLRPKQLQDPPPRHRITAHNAWLETGETVQLGLGSGRRLSLVLLERVQARPSFGVGTGYVTSREQLRWKARVRLSAEDARALAKEGIRSWSFRAPGLEIHREVKRTEFLRATVDCVLN